MLALALASLSPGCASGPTAAEGQVAAVQPCGSSGSALPAAGCGLVCRAVLPVQVQDNLPIVTAWINDQPANLLLDTGASVSNLTPDAVARLGLPRAVPALGQVWGIGGGQARSLVTVRRLAFGDVRIDRPRLEVLVTARPAAGLVPDGGLGDDVLSEFEVDLDLPHGRATLYQGRPCDGHLPGWPVVDAALPWTRAFPVGLQVAIPATLEGHAIQALIDSGAETTVVGDASALASGLPESELASDLETHMVGVGPGQLPARLHRFSALAVGGQTLPDVETAVIALPFASFGMVLGADYLQTHKVWISYASGRVFVAHTW